LILTNYIPDHYLSTKINNQWVLHRSPFEKENQADFTRLVFEEAVSLLQEVFPSIQDVAINLCIYHTLHDGMYSLQRKIKKTHLLTPYCVEQEALIVCFSAVLDKKNTDKNRMLRHFIHELTHVVITVNSSSSRVLGDRLKLLNVPVWFDEGLAEYLALNLSNRKQEIIDSIEYFEMNQDISIQSLECILKNVENANWEDTLNAYKWATGKVAHYISQKYPKGLINLDAACWPVINKYLKDV
jgi:hypothetical protein